MAAFDRDILCRAVRQCYLTCLRLHTNKSVSTAENPYWDGGTNAYGRRYSPVWPKIADFILRHNADPMEFIQAQFWHSDDGRPPKPNMLYNDQALGKYRKHRRGGVSQLRKAWEAGARELAAEARLNMEFLGWPFDRAMRQACLLTTSQASPMIRYGLASKAGLAMFVQSLRPAALAEYVCRAETADKALGEAIPEELRTEGRRLRQKLLQG